MDAPLLRAIERYVRYVTSALMYRHRIYRFYSFYLACTYLSFCLYLSFVTNKDAHNRDWPLTGAIKLRQGHRFWHQSKGRMRLHTS